MSASNAEPPQALNQLRIRVPQSYETIREWRQDLQSDNRLPNNDDGSNVTTTEPQRNAADLLEEETALMRAIWNKCMTLNNDSESASTEQSSHDQPQSAQQHLLVDYLPINGSQTSLNPGCKKNEAPHLYPYDLDILNTWIKGYYDSAVRELELQHYNQAAELLNKVYRWSEDRETEYRVPFRGPFSNHRSTGTCLPKAMEVDARDRAS